MSLIVLGLSSFLIALSGALVPGPLFTLTVSESARRGASTGPLIILGHGILEVLIVVLVLSGLSPFLTRDTTRYVISLAGGGMLIIMGIFLIHDIPKTRLDLGAGNHHTRTPSEILQQGVLPRSQGDRLTRDGHLPCRRVDLEMADRDLRVLWAVAAADEGLDAG